MAKSIGSVDLLEKTLELVRTRTITLTYKQIEAETDIPSSWLKMFSRGEIADPSVNRVVKLYEYLSGHELKV